MSAKEESWSSNFGFMMAMIGSAVGLGSIWRFPYMVAQSGGSAFIFIYVTMMLVVGIIGMAVETALGRNSGVDAVDSYAKIAPKSKILGYIPVLTGFLLATIYTVLGGWALSYFAQSLFFQLGNNDFEAFRVSQEPLFWQILFLFLTMLILSLGVSKGIEKYSTLMNFLLLGMILIIVFFSLQLEGAMAGVYYLFTPKFEAFKDPTIWLMATGQAFFSLSLGSGAILTYGVYVDKKSPILRSSAITAIASIVMALLMGLAIFPAVFAMGQEPNAGPGLLFVTLPLVFNKMPGGAIFAILFFAATVFAALTSSVSMIEPALRRISNQMNISRTKTTWSLFAILVVLGAPMALAPGLLSSVKILGLNLFDTMNFLIDKIMMPFNGIVTFILAGWLWKKRGIVTELLGEEKSNSAFGTFLLWLVRLIAPTLVAIAVLKPLYDYIITKLH
ncbi:sodium-dependent transporter [Entomospira culicis]|uniref:Sodium-dependent transporter n=1 Tax=Entomospira culicis TaxID=2719989 RepID=A0A968GFF3_9SPIO|nr:sodium-dependent transporter [Entomospira culicis]NIZ19546.1 sodium-dependent transporter [Entomospira culicis]NIZ69549.1 sodium-dependent transporter [Entomospira culicis]WDI36660.1 sodium-dependent transporter [Entomospira culicis]WDI38289.1 sodium-dependent transporter [Entomospira culicis]